MKNYLISDWLSPDEKYVIFMDELYDIENKTKLGNVLEDFNNFVFFLRHSYSVSNLPRQVVSECMSELNNLLLTESTKNIKNILLEFEFDPIGWIKQKGSEAIKGVGEFIDKSAKGMGDFVKNISKGDFAKAFSIIGKGLLYIARSIRSAMYHPVGLVLDAILVATGIGKSVQWIPWAIIVALDVAELTGMVETENKDLPLGIRLLFFGTDILGLVLAGGVAKAAKTLITTSLRGAKTTQQMAKIVAKTPGLKSIIQKIGGALGSVSGKMNQAVSFLSKKFPKAADFIKSILGKVSGFVNKLSNSVNGLLNRSISKAQLAPKLTTGQKVVKGGKAGATTTGLVYGIEKGVEKFMGKGAQNQEQEILNAIKSADLVWP